MLWPYRRSALKNQRRWTFGGVLPAARTARAHPRRRVRDADAVPARGRRPARRRRDRALPARRRRQAWTRRPAGRRADVDGERHLLGRGGRARGRRGRGERGRRSRPAALESGRGGASCAAGSARGSVELRASGRRRRARDGADRERHAVARATARRRCGARSARRTRVLRARRRVRLADRPAGELRGGGGLRERRHLAGAGRRAGDATLLSSPIILEDYPRIAPESPGDLFDGGEIDQLLVLNILA